MREARLLGLPLLLLCWLASPAAAGWVIEQVHSSIGPKGRTAFEQTSTVFVSGNKVYARHEPLELVADFSKGELLLLLQEKKLYWRGLISEYVDEVRELVRGPAFQRPPSGEGEKEKRREVKIRVEATGSEETVAGYPAEKYIVYADGKVFQEIWIAPGVGIAAELDVEKLNEFQHEASGGIRGRTADAYRALVKDREYRKLYRKGFPVRIQARLGESILRTEVRRIEKRALDEGLFSPPAGFARVSLARLFDERNAVGR
ncbi:MAG: hypothetical protein KatS3mg076_2903 [Candidatus Binatia bacterium]|nr:MAG: hypothetical protein KatS3mg076_2903 [Candidatus Binatia bacterium]